MVGFVVGWQFRLRGADVAERAGRRDAAAEGKPVNTISVGEGGAAASASAQPSHGDTATVRIAYSDATLTVPMNIDPTISETAPLIDVERMITDEAFAGQSFPDFVCPPGLVLCPKTAGAEAKVLKSYATGAYQPTESWCREVWWKASVNGRTNYASGLQMQMLQATLVANNVQPGTEKRSFNPYGYYLYRALMAAEVCLGLRQ